MGVPTSRLAALVPIFILVLASCATPDPTPDPTPAGAVPNSWVLEVAAAGPHWLGADWLEAHGIPPALVPGQVRLSRAGQPVPYLWLEGPTGRGLFFYAVAAPTRYTPHTAYRLEVGQGSGQTMTTTSLPATPTPPSNSQASLPVPADNTPTGEQRRPAAPGDAPSSPFVQDMAPPQDSAWADLWQEQDLDYRPQIASPLPWFWQPIFSGQRVTHTVELTEALAGPITVTVRLWERTSFRDQGLPPRVLWDGQEVGQWQWGGPDTQSWPAELTDPANGEHLLAVEMPAQADSPVNQVWLDGVGLTFHRPLRLKEPGITWLAEGEQAALTGAEGARLLDVTDPTAPLDLGPVEGGSIPTLPGHRYWLGMPWLSPPPLSDRLATTVDLAALSKARYLAVVPEPFVEALQPLLAHRQGQGLAVARLTPTQVYDAFGDGRPDPEAIRAMVVYLHRQGQLRYLLLVGDASAKAEGYVGQAGSQRIVTALVPIVHLHETPSDQAMVLDDDGNPLVAVGRLPAQTAEELEIMVAKTIEWEKSGRASTVLLSDDEPDFGQFADDMLVYLPAPAERLDAADETARSRLLAQLDQQTVWLNYVGHGSLTLWGDEKLLQSEDEWSQPAVVTVWACLSAYFVHPSQDSMAEVWLRAAQGGAVAFVGPTGETYLYQQRPLAKVLYQEVKAGRPLGDALLAAWQQAGEAEQDAVRSFLLLGDPALRLSP